MMNDGMPSISAREGPEVFRIQSLPSASIDVSKSSNALLISARASGRILSTFSLDHLRPDKFSLSLVNLGSFSKGSSAVISQSVLLGWEIYISKIRDPSG